MTDRIVDAWLSEHTDDLIAIRRHLHAHPELSNEEHATTELIAARLDAAGLTARRFSSGTGLLSDLGPDRTDRGRLALRADIDALAMTDDKDVPYRSRVPGVCHACGHDVHTAILLGVAEYFADHPDQLDGPIRCIFQPAEERVPGGALEVLADGGIDGVDAMYGLHCMPKLDVGVVGLRAGSITSAADMATIILSGPGGHTARPEETVDLVTVAARVVAELPREIDALVGDPAHVKFVFGSIHGGDAANVIPTRCTMKASIRTPVLQVWETLEAVVDKALRTVLDASGAEFRLEYVTGVPPVVNDPDLIDTARRAVVAEFGETGVATAEQSWGGDDFAWYSREVPAAYLRLGVHEAGSPVVHDLHVGRFDVDESAIAAGVTLMVAVVREHFATMS
ncbi:MAG: amidohydrolase [Ilumatobacteraceae bacterium]